MPEGFDAQDTSISWQETLWREAQSCFDDVYAKKLMDLLPDTWPSTSHDKVMLATVLVSFFGFNSLTELSASYTSQKGGVINKHVQNYTWFALMGVLGGYAMLLVIGAWFLNIGTVQDEAVWFICVFSLFIVTSLFIITLGLSLLDKKVTKSGLTTIYKHLKRQTTSAEANLIIYQLPRLLVNRLYLPRPTPADVEAALHQASETNAGLISGLKQLDAMKQSNPPAIDALISQLQAPRGIDRFIARHALIHHGGIAMSHLAQLESDAPNLRLQQIALWMLRQIADDSFARLTPKPNQWLCTNCIGPCKRLSIDSSSQRKIVFAGCPICHNSRDVIPHPQEITIVLDSENEMGHIIEGDRLLTNWFSQERVLIFDRIEIRHITDQAVEQFVVDIHAQASTRQQARFKQIPYTISPTCQLSENSLRILDQTFGENEQTRYNGQN
ncbi:MAG: hypothetical protein AAF485_13710 [Chloroflexota bacterium]